MFDPGNGGSRAPPLYTLDVSNPSESIRARFERLAATPDADLDVEEGAILIAAEEYPDLDVDAVSAELDLLGDEAKRMLAGIDAPADRIEKLNQFLFEDLGFEGASEYFDPRNSYLNEVIDRRVGIPITLALVYIGVGSRAGLDLRGVSFPGHFLVRTPGEPPVILDAFDGSLVSVVDCERRLKAALGPTAILDPALLGAATPREILVRMLGNLKNGFLGDGDWISAIDCCDRLLLVAPELASELRDRGILWTRLGFVAPAIEDLERFLERVPNAPEAEQLRQEIVRLKAEDVTLH